MLAESLLQDNIAVCVKNADKMVLEQNDLCRAICGDCLGEVCEQGCMALYARDADQQWKTWGSRVYTNGCVQNAFFDVTLLCSDRHIITFLQPLKDKYDMAMRYYRARGLTQRETDVVSLAIRGITNADICKRLLISRATLRTHLNNIYRKLRDLGEVPEFMPPCRLSG
jgi:DNA-binding CsgD family transcriptional regulator